MAFLMYFAGLTGTILIAGGIAALYIKIPHPVVQIDIRRPNLLLKIAGIILIAGGSFNLISDVYFGIKHWRETSATTQQVQTPPVREDIIPTLPETAPSAVPAPEK